MTNNQFDQLHIDKSKLVLATDKVITHDARLVTKPIGFFQDAMKRFAKNKASVVAAIIICILFLYAIVGPWISPYEISYKNTEKSYQLPFIPGLEWLGFDGCREEELTENDYHKYMAMGQESGLNPIVKVIEIKQNYKPGRPEPVNVYVCKINTYYKSGIVTKNLTKEQFLKLQEYQNDTGIQIVYPACGERNSQINKYDANYWYITDKKGNPKLDENGLYQNNYLPYAGNDIYDSLRVEGEGEKLYNYATIKGSGSGDGVSYDVRVKEYLYDQYLNAKFVEDDEGGHFVPGAEPVYWFGTNQYGEDIFTRLAYGARFSFLLAVVVAAVNLTVGAIYGAIEGYYGGVVDMVMERVSDILASVPMYVVIALLKWYIVPELPSGVGVLLSLFMAFFITGWIGMAGSVRRQFYRFKNQEFVMAARTLGASDFRLMFKHIFPNSLGTLVTSCVLVIPGVIFSESSLSYLGIIKLDTETLISVGTMLSQGNSAGISKYPHIILWPALFIALLEISFNLFGNGLRDAFNPSLRGSEG